MELLAGLVESRLPHDARAWLADARAQAARGDVNGLATVYTAAAVRVGRAPLAASAADAAALAAAAPLAGVGFDRWTLTDGVRAVLLASRRTAGRAGEAFAADALACFDLCDAGEQQSWLRAASLWPEAEALRAVVIDACRTNILPLFEAVACENPYPARYFPERNFNQMVLKAMFNGVALSRIVGLPERRNADLARMARDYAAERRAAGRSVPGDIGLALEGPAAQEMA
ncbi:MAG: EboA domain-containing protein [Acidobacteriota bacterium]